jgi:choline dehydrogenase-like flavoprotein
MKTICVVGAGAIGGWLAEGLARQGCQVSMLARGATLAALQRDGLRVLKKHTNEATGQEQTVEYSQALEAFLIEKGGQAPCVWVPWGTPPAAECPAALAQTMPARTMVARRAAKSLSTKSPNAWPVSSAGVQLFLVSASCQALVLVALVIRAASASRWFALHSSPRGCGACPRSDS